MLAGEPFDFTAPDVAESLRRRRVNQAHFNAVSFDDGKAYDEALSALIPPSPSHCPDHAAVLLRPRSSDSIGRRRLYQRRLHVSRLRRHHDRRPHAHRPRLPYLHAAASDRLRRAPQTRRNGPPDHDRRGLLAGSRRHGLPGRPDRRPLDHRRRERRRARHSRGLAGRGKSGGREAGSCAEDKRKVHTTTHKAKHDADEPDDKDGTKRYGGPDGTARTLRRSAAPPRLQKRS